MEIILDKIHINEIKRLTLEGFGDFIKAVVDIKKEIMVIDAELHSDEESLLLENGSQQSDLWGINIYFDKNENVSIEFDSLINIRPRQGNLSRDIEDIVVREKIKQIVLKMIIND